MSRLHPLVRRAPGDYLLVSDDLSVMLRIRRYRFEFTGSASVWWVSYKPIPEEHRDLPWWRCPDVWLAEWLADGWTRWGNPAKTRKAALEGASELIAGRTLRAVR